MVKWKPNSTFWKSRNIPEPVSELKFHPERRWRFDFAWPEYWVALEVEGGTWISGRHNRGSGMRKDLEKYNEATLLGWKLLRFPTDLMNEQNTAGKIRKLIFNRRNEGSS